MTSLIYFSDVFFFQFTSVKMSTKQQQQKFVQDLTGGEKNYLWSHVYRYAGVEGTTAKEQFQQIVSYVLNFLTGESDLEKRIYAKALKVFE